MATRTKKTISDASEQNAELRNSSEENNNAATKQQNSQNDRQSQLATILVGLLIIASGLLIYNYFQKTTAPDTTSQTEQQDDEQKQQSNSGQNGDSDSESESKEGQYTVMPGDSLWSIAEKAYGDGFQWTKIRDANELDLNAFGQPTVEIGQVLNVPDSAAVAQQPKEVADGTGNTGDDSDVAGVQEIRETPSTAVQTYTVQPGDTLWSIAESFYGDGNDWELISNDPHNQIGQLPDGRPLVHAGNALYIPQAP